jgi:P27 family predicted phage terminase small subunit
MPSGRKPIPTHLKVVRGNPGKRPLNENEPTPEGPAEMPEYLSPAAREHWPIVAKQLEDAGVLTSIDVHALALYCEAFARWRNALAEVARSGPVYTTPQGFAMQSPHLSIANKAQEQMTKLLIEFGMTPSSRTRVTKAPKDEQDPFKAFVKKPRAQ